MKYLLAALTLVLLAAPASALNDASVQAKIGDLPAHGRSALLGDDGADNRFLLAAKQGETDAESDIYYMYHRARGVPQDDAETVELYRLAAEQGVARAQSNFAYMHFVGQGVAQNYVEAAKWFRLAAEQGHADSQNNLAYMYVEGLGVPQADGEAVTWYGRAAEQGVAIAQTSLGHMFFEGRGKPRDYVQAHKWFILAAVQGDEKAAEDRRVIADFMTASQIAEAERLAHEWLDQHRK